MPRRFGEVSLEFDSYSVSNKPLKVDDLFPEAEIAAYCRNIFWGDVPMTPGTEAEILVYAPYYGYNGRSFWFRYGEDEFIRAVQVAVVKEESYTATILVRIYERRSLRSFVKQQPVPEVYSYKPPEGDSKNGWIRRCGEDFLEVENSYGGDLIQRHYIYTDQDGIDHLLMVWDIDFDGSYAYVGDRILGRREQRPYQWEM